MMKPAPEKDNVQLTPDDALERTAKIRDRAYVHQPPTERRVINDAFNVEADENTEVIRVEDAPYSFSDKEYLDCLNAGIVQISKHLEGVDGRLDGIDDRLAHLEVGSPGIPLVAMTVQERSKMFCGTMLRMRNAIHLNSIAKGFYEWTFKHDLPDEYRTACELAKLALIGTEVSEAIEVVRKGIEKSEHDHGIDPLAEELADIVIRCLDFAGYSGIDLGDAILRKHAYNLGRAHQHGGKKA